MRVVASPGDVIDAFGAPAGPFHRMQARLAEEEKPNRISLLIPLNQRCFEEAHKYMAHLRGAAPECYVHKNPSVDNITSICCDRLISKAQPVAKHAYLFNEVPMPLSKFQEYATCREPSGWLPCRWRATEEDIACYKEPDFVFIPGSPHALERLLNCAVGLLDVVVAEDRVSPHLQFEAAYLAVYLLHNGKKFTSLEDIVAFAGPHLRLAAPYFLPPPPGFFDEDYEELLIDAAEKQFQRN